MPIYEYRGQQYEMAETDPAVAKARILSYLGETVAPPATPPPASTRAPAPIAPTRAFVESDMGAADPFMTGIASAISAEPGAAQSRSAGYQSVLERYNIEQAGKQIPFTPEEGAALSSLTNIQRTQAQVAKGREIQARQQAARQAQRETAKAEDYGITDFLKDTAIDPFKGAVSLGEAYIGLLNLTSGGAAGRVLGDLGYDPERTKKFLTGFQSLTRQEADRSVEEAEGFINTLSALFVNPTALLGTVVESLPGTVLSGAVGGRFVRFLAGKAANEATSLGLTGAAAEKFIADRIKEQSFKIAAVASGAEGLQTAGSIAEAARQGGREWSDYILPALGAGFGTAAIGAVGGKAAAKMGIGDIETSIATRSAGIKGVTPAEGPAFIRILKEAVKEGVFEELPQSTQEKVFENIALGRPWDEGIGKAAATGLVAGLAMGGGNAAVVAALQRSASSPEVKEFDAEALARSKGFLGGIPAAARARARAPAPAPAPAAAAPAAAPAPAAQERIEPTFDETASIPATAEGRIEPTLEGAPPAAPAPAPASDALLAALGIAPAPDRLAPGAPTPLSPEEIEAKIAQYAQFMPEEDARRTVMDEQRAASEAAEAKAAAPAPAPAAPPQLDETTQRLKDLTQERIDAGVPPQQAALQALEQLQKEAQADVEEEQRVAGTVTAPSGEGAGVAGVALIGAPTERAGGTERTGVVLTAEDAGQPAARKGAKPGAVRQLALEEQKAAGWNPDWPFIPADLVNADFRQLIRDDPNLSAEEKRQIFESGYKLGVVPKSEVVAEAPPAAPKTNEEILAAATDAELAKALTQYGGSEVGRLPPDLIQGEIAKRKAAAAAKPEVKPAGKRGRKPLPLEEKAKSDERRKEQRRESNAASREVDRMEAELAEAKKPVEPGDYPNETEYTEGKISQGMRRKRILAALHDFARTNKNKPGQRAKELLEAEATAQEIADIAKGYDLRKQAARKISPTQKDESRAPDPVNIKFNAVRTGAQAISVLLRTGTLFQKFMAARIRNAVRNVNVVVLEKDDPLPAQLSTPMAKSYWDTARALYIYSDAEGKGTVYLRGESFGNDQGINNVTVLHELLHAATAQKIQLALRLIKKGVDLNSPAVKAVLDLRETMRAAADEFIRLNNAGRIPKDLADLYMASRGAIFTDVREFVSYGLTDVGFQRFLNRVTDVVEPSETFFSRFVDAIRKLFGVPEGMHTAMTNLVLATDKVIASRKSDRMKMLEARDVQLAKIAGEKQRISAQDKRTLDEIDKEVDEALLKFQRSKTADEAADNLSLLHSLRKWDDTKRHFNSIYDTVDAAKLEGLLAPMPTDVVAAWGSSYVPELKNTNNILIDMRAMQYQLVSSAAEVSENITRAITKDPSLFDKLARVMSVATDVRVDPATDPRNKTLNNLYTALGPEGQRIYTEVRDYYARMVQLYTSLLDAQITDANLPPDAKNKLMAQIRKQFETDKKIVPYFPFVRNRGPFWLRVKRSRSEPAEFYMLGSIAERDAVAAAIAKEMNRSVDELYNDESFQSGDTTESLRRKSGMLDLGDGIKSIFNEIDNLASLGPKDKDKVKDSVYELYLMALPEQTFRKGFIDRKDVTGYSTDVVRAFSTSSLRFANQLPRIKYSQKLSNSILAGRQSLKGNPDAAKLERFIDEMEGRIKEELNPQIDTGLARAVVNASMKATFIYYMSAASSALLQMAGLLYGAARLGARHGYPQTALEMGKMMRIFGEYSVIKKNSDGSVSLKPPTVALSKRVTANPMERRAAREILGLVSEMTITSDLLRRGRTSTAKFEGRGSQIGRGFNTLIGGLFHTIERLVRETIFMSSFRMSMKEGQKKGMSGEDLYQYAKQQAVADVYASVGDMSLENRAPMFKGVVGGLLSQYLHSPLFITIRWAQEFKRMMPFMGNEAKFQAFKEFAGIMGVTYLLGGVVALPFIKEMAGFIGAMFDDWDDEDKPAEMRNMSYWTYWANVWLPEYMGKMGIFGKSLEEVTGMDKDELAALITRGPTNLLTGRDISSRVSINPTDMIMGSTKEVRTTKEGALQFAEERYGPAINMVLSTMDAYDAWQNGDMQKTMEKLLPAVARNVVVAEKYREEGVKDFKNKPLITKDQYTTGDYLYQLIGLRPDDLANHQKVLFETSKGENKIRFERERIISNARESELKKDNKRLQQAVQDRNKFNKRYPEYEITQEDVDRSINMSIEELTESFKGFRPTEKNERIFAPTAVASGRALAASREKKAEK